MAVHEKTQSWDDVKNFTEGIKCHVCRTDKDVKRGLLETVVMFGFMPIPGNSTHWQLCKNCKGWTVEANPYSGNLHYSFFRKIVVPRPE